MGETQLDRLERTLNTFVEYAQGRFEAIAVEFRSLREELNGLRGELNGLRGEFEAFRTETREKFENVTDRLDALQAAHTSGLSAVTGEVARLRAEVEALRIRSAALEGAALVTNARIGDLREEIKQRFRLVNERLAAVEKKLAA